MKILSACYNGVKVSFHLNNEVTKAKMPELLTFQKPVMVLYQSVLVDSPLCSLSPGPHVPVRAGIQGWLGEHHVPRTGRGGG